MLLQLNDESPVTAEKDCLKLLKYITAVTAGISPLRPKVNLVGKVESSPTRLCVHSPFYD